MIKYITRSAYILAKASKGNPAMTTGTVILFFLCFSQFEAMIEKLIFGERFEHWLDPIFMAFFIAYSAMAVVSCAIVNSEDGV